MRIFNLAVTTIWVAMFWMSLTPTNSTGPYDLHDEIINTVNYQLAVTLDGTAISAEGYAIPMNESEFTQSYLREYFGWFMFWMASLNLVFYAGKGTFGKASGAIMARAELLRQSWNKKKESEGEVPEAPRPLEFSDQQLLG